MADFIIYYESTVREFDSAALIKAELERRGYSAVISAAFWGDLWHNCRFSKNSVTVVPWAHKELNMCVFAENTDKAKIINLFCEQIFNNQTGGMALFEDLESVKNTYHTCWGIRSREALEKFGIPGDKLPVTGSVRLDLFRPEFGSLYKTKHELSPEFSLPENKKWILYISSFSILEVVSNPDSSGVILKNIGLTAKLYETHRKMQDITLDWICRFCRENEDSVFIYRPHPGNEILTDKIIHMTETLSNFRVIKDYTLAQWINVCDVIDTCISTSSAEIWRAGKGFNVVRPVPLDFSEDYPIYDDCEIIDTYEKFALCHGDTDFPLNKDLLSEYYSITETPAYIKYCDFFEKALKDNSEESYQKIKTEKKLFLQSNLSHIFAGKDIRIFSSVLAGLRFAVMIPHDRFVYDSLYEYPKRFERENAVRACVNMPPLLREKTDVEKAASEIRDGACPDRLSKYSGDVDVQSLYETVTELKKAAAGESSAEHFLELMSGLFGFNFSKQDNKADAVFLNLFERHCREAADILLSDLCGEDTSKYDNEDSYTDFGRLIEGKEIIIYGAVWLAHRAILFFNRFGFKVSCVWDGKNFSPEKSFIQGVPVKKMPEIIPENALVFNALTEGINLSYGEVEQTLKDKGCETADLMCLLGYVWKTNGKMLQGRNKMLYSTRTAYDAICQDAAKVIADFPVDSRDVQKIVLYGAGKVGRAQSAALKSRFADWFSYFPVCFWDEEAENIREYDGIPVETPVFSAAPETADSFFILVCLADKKDRAAVTESLIKGGYKNVFSCRETYFNTFMSNYVDSLSFRHTDSYAFKKRLIFGFRQSVYGKYIMDKYIFEDEDIRRGTTNKKRVSQVNRLVINLHDACNLHCRGCLRSSDLFKKSPGFAAKPDVDYYLKQVDAMMNLVDFVFNLTVATGESFLFQDELLAVLKHHMKIKKLFSVNVITNGTIPIKNRELLDFIKAHSDRIRISVDDYNVAGQYTEKFIERLESCGIVHNVITDDMQWFDSWDWSFKNHPEYKLKPVFEGKFSDKKFVKCRFANHGIVVMNGYVYPRCSQIAAYHNMKCDQEDYPEECFPLFSTPHDEAVDRIMTMHNNPPQKFSACEHCSELSETGKIPRARQARPFDPANPLYKEPEWMSETV